MYKPRHYHTSLYELKDDDGELRLKELGDACAERETARSNAECLNRKMPVEAILFYTYNSRACEEDCQITG